MDPNKSIYNDLSIPKNNKNFVNKINIICRPFVKVPARLVLYFMSLSGFMVSYMLRTDMNVAIVSMVEQIEILDNTNNTCSKYFNPVTNISIPPDIDYNYDGKLDWNSDVQSYVLAAFYWTYLLSQILGAMLAQKLGSKFVYGIGQLSTAICTLFIPLACDSHYGIVIFLRSIQGFFSGVTWPAMFSLMAIWVPVTERTRFVSCLQGYNLGIGFNYPLCGYLITYLGWKSVFYTTGTIGVVWCILWYFLVFDTPDSHPRITPEEKQYIKDNTTDTTTATNGVNHKKEVPWIKILTSMPVWAITISGFGWIWVNYVLIIGGPTYLSSIQGFNIRKSGILSGTPFLASFPIALIFCYIADSIIRNNLLSVTNTRKLFTALGQVVPGAMIIIIGYLGCSTDAVIVVWFIAITMPTAMYAGTMANITEIAPALAGHVIAVVQTIYMIASFASPLVTGYLTKDGNTITVWQNIFNLAAGLSISTYIIYAVWGTSKVQSWNLNISNTDRLEQEIMLQPRKSILIRNNTT